MEYNHYNSKDISYNTNNYNNFNNTTSNRINIYRQNFSLNNYSPNSNSKTNNTNIYKSTSSVSINKPEIYKTQVNYMNYNNHKNINEDNKNNTSDSINKKISSFKYDKFKQKRLKRDNHNINNNISINERKKKFIKFNHMPFDSTPNKENKPILTKQMDNPSSDKNENYIDPTIKILINPIKIIEKKNFKRKLYPVHPQVKLNKLILLNNSLYKRNNNDESHSIHDIS